MFNMLRLEMIKIADTATYIIGLLLSKERQSMIN